MGENGKKENIHKMKRNIEAWAKIMAEFETNRLPKITESDWVDLSIFESNLIN